MIERIGIPVQHQWVPNMQSWIDTRQPGPDSRRACPPPATEYFTFMAVYASEDTPRA